MKPLKIAHHLWQKHLECKESCVIDATCGNGHDSLFLASLKGVTLHCVDIQELAIENTKKRLFLHPKTLFHHRSHNDLSFIKEPIDLIVYNLGYLPGSDKTVITTPDESLSSLKSALSIIKPQGMISLMIYTGHNGGEEEKVKIFSFLEQIAAKWSISHITHPFKLSCPEILVISSNSIYIN